MKFVQKILGTQLVVEFYEDDEIQKILFEKSIQRISKFEQKYSRFIDGNFLSKLNTSKRASLDDELRSLLTLAKKVSELSLGYFDITVRPFLENRGYGIEKNTLTEIYGSQHIELTDSEVILHNGVSLDFGAFGKGYMIDVIFEIFLGQKSDFIIDFGGDIKVKGKQNIRLEDPISVGKYIGNIEVKDTSIAGSSGSKRKFGTGNHLINPLSPDKQSDIVGVFTIHKLALFADIFSTALFVSPVDTALKLMQETRGLSACIILTNGTVHKSADFNAHFS